MHSKLSDKKIRCPTSQCRLNLCQSTYFAFPNLQLKPTVKNIQGKIQQASLYVYKFFKVLYNKPITRFIFINIVKSEMQIDETLLSFNLQAIFQYLQSHTRISQSKAKQLFLKITTLISTSKYFDAESVRICLKILLHLQNKTFNFNSKYLPEFWKVFINLLLQLLSFSKTTPQKLQKSDISSATLQDFYKVILSNKIEQWKQKLTLWSSEDLVLILEVWSKCFSLSDVRSLQYAVISLQLCWMLQASSQEQQSQTINKSIMEITQKVCLNLVKYAQRTKEFDTYENLVRLIGKIENDFYQKFEKQIQSGIHYYCQASRLTQGTNPYNIHANVWEKVVLAQCACISKRLNDFKSVEEAVSCLEKLRRSLLFEKMINLSKDGRRTYSSLCLNISASQLQQFLFGMLLDIWIHLQIFYEAQIGNMDGQSYRKNLYSKLTKYKQEVLVFFKILTKRELNVLMVRELVKRLQIVKHSSAVTQWKQIFVIINLLLKTYPKPQNLIEFTDEKSYISKLFSPALKFPFTVQLKIKGQSIPFKEEKILIQFSDSSTKEKIWITMRNYDKNLIIFSFVKLIKNNLISKEQKESKWNQYESNTIQIVLKNNKIKLSVNHNEENVLFMPNSLAQVDQIVLCDRQSGMGSTICQLFSFKIIQYSIFEDNEKKEIDLVPFFDPRCPIKSSMKENLKFYKCQKVQQNSLIYFMETLGDLELFILLLYHTLKKIKNQDQLLKLIRMTLDLLQDFTLHKQVQNQQLTQQQKNSRRKSILCLSWFFAKETKSVFVIFQLIRFLYIRGRRCNEQILKFLCNFSYWRDFKLEKQILIVMKIKEILKQSSKQEQKIHNLIYCKKIMFDMILYFKQSHYLMAEKQSCLKLHQFILQTVYEQIKQIIEIPNKKSKTYILDILCFIQFTTNLVSCILNRKISEEAFDITFVIQITLFLRDIAKMLFVSKERKFITKTDIDVALELYFKKEQKQLIVPLSLNAQQLLDERFNLYLSRIMSTSKSLITLFDTETFYFEESHFKIYPINCQSAIYCNDTKVHTNVINFNIYMSMLSEKSWNYILFGMPLSEYTQRFCQSIWRICFYELFKEKKFFPRVCKMLELTPFPQSEYCLMKIFQVLVFYPMFDKDYLYRVLKSQNFTKFICPFKIQQILIKYLNKLQPQIYEMEGMEVASTNILQNAKLSTENLQQERIYFILLHSMHTDYDSCKDLLVPLKYRKSYSSYNIIVYHIILKSLVKLSRLKINQRKLQNNQIQSSIQLNQQQKSRQNSLSPQGFSQDSETSSIESSMLVKCKQTQNTQTYNFITQKSYQQLISYALEALEFYFKQLTLNHVKDFLKIQSYEDAKPHRLNFTINVECMIKALKNCKEQRSSLQFQKYLSFIEFYLINFSLHLIKGKFPNFKSDSFGNENADQNVKKGRTKLLYKTLSIDLIKISTSFFVDQVKQRRTQLHSLQQMWNEVQRKNKFFWNLFISQNKYYSLSEITTEFGERLLLTISNDKPKIQLPKMINKQSMMCSMSLVSSQKLDPSDQSELSTLFDECQLLKTQLQENQCKNKDRIRKGSHCLKAKQIKTKKFRVLLITNNKIYQGLLFMAQRDVVRFEETYPSEKLYDKIGATAQERRDDDEIQKDPRCFDIILGSASKIFIRKYLFFDAGLEIFSHEKASFFCFDSDQKRTKFCSIYLKDNTVLTYRKIKKAIEEETKKWLNGLTSNYEYLMKINQCANRTINDLSQYYVLPWTITQFDKKQIDKAYIIQSQNFRDMTKPLGKASQKKWNQINTRFQMSFGSNQSKIQSDIQPFLYGAFYSNPAIVTNYMIRVEPFSSLHYLLQSQKIDLADRLFFQFSDQYKSIMTNTSDIKELIPEFYINAQFLKNRSKLNLGYRQNKEIVNDVRLPKWADNAYEFVFKMKYFLQSPIVSKFLNHWIDLIFGVYAKKQNALSADNLYMSEIYGPDEMSRKQKPQDKKNTAKKRFEDMKNSSLEQLENRILFNKEFGIIPLTLFDEKHPQLQTMEGYYVFKGIVETLFCFNKGITEAQSQISMIQNLCIVLESRSLRLIDTNSADFSQKENFKVTSEIELENEVFTPKLIQGKSLGSLLPYLFYVKRLQKKICSRFIKKAKFFGSLELRDEYDVMDGQCFNWIDDEVLVVGNNNTLRIYSFEQCSIRQKGAKVVHLKIQESKAPVPVREFPIFTQHQAEISFIQTNQDLKLIVSIDEINKVFILKYSPHDIELINSFTIKICHFEEKIIKLLVHKMSLIICLTNYQRLLTFNFYGDLIGAKQVDFSLDASNTTQKVNCIKLFNKESSELLMGTNLGNVWKVDLFEFYKSEEEISAKDLWFQSISLNSKDLSCDIRDLLVKRYGRHWQIYVVSADQKKRKVISKIRCLTMKQLYSSSKKSC